MHVTFHEVVQGGSNTHPTRPQELAISLLKLEPFPGFPVSVYGINSHCPSRNPGHFQPVKCSQVGPATSPLAYGSLHMCPRSLEHARISAWLTPICLSSLDGDTSSSKKPSLMLPAWINPLLSPHSTSWCLVRAPGL